MGGNGRTVKGEGIIQVGWVMRTLREHVNGRLRGRLGEAWRYQACVVTVVKVRSDGGAWAKLWAGKDAAGNVAKWTATGELDVLCNVRT